MNSDKQVAVYDNSVSARTYLSYIAEQAGGFACIGRDGKLYIKTIGQSTAELPLKYFQNFKWGENIKITRVRYEDGIQLFEKGDTTGNTFYINQENMYIVNQEQIDNIYKQLNGLEVYSFEGESIIDPALDVGDILIIDGKKVIYQGSSQYSGKFKASISSKIQCKAKEETTTRIPSQAVINRRVQSQIDQANGEIILLSKQQKNDKSELQQAIGATEDEFNEFINETYAQQVNSLQSQIDGQIMSFFYDYEPTLSNIPASEWTTEDEKIKHMGDLFYNSDTGLGYRFSYINNQWKWEELKDTDVGRALANAENALNVANNKRRVFTIQPTPPYDVGDLWITDTKELKSCIVAKENGSYEETDWQDFVYTEKINEATEAVNIIEETVTNLKLETDSINATVSETVSKLNNDYLTAEQIEAENNTIKEGLEIIKQQQASMELTSTGLQVQIDTINNEGVKTVKNTTVDINENGVTVGKSDSEFSTTMSNTGTYMYSYEKQIAKYDKDGAEMYNLTVQNEAIIGNLRCLSVEVEGEKRTHIHWIGG